MVLFTVFITVGWFASYLFRYIPFETEVKITREYSHLQKDLEDNSPLQLYLQALSDKVSNAMELPDPMRVHLHYVDTKVVNAFATLGGHVILFRGLLEKLPHENALVMLLAHEFAHIKHRDPIAGIGYGVALSICQAALLGNSGGDILGSTGLLTALNFSREMECDADRLALTTLHKVYGHVNGATDLFQLFMNERKKLGVHEPPPFLSSHPLDLKRIREIEDLAQKHNWIKNKAITPLPVEFQKWLITKQDFTKNTKQSHRYQTKQGIPLFMIK